MWERAHIEHVKMVFAQLELDYSDNAVELVRWLLQGLKTRDQNLHLI